MTGAELLVAGKALIWFALPLLLAVNELRLLRRAARRTGLRSGRDGQRVPEATRDQAGLRKRKMPQAR